MPSLQEVPSPIAKPLKLGVAAFFVALCGVAIGFVIDYGPSNPLSFVVFGVVALAVAIGFFAVQWGWFSIYRHHGAGRR
jgi:hypothetical protein